MNTLEQTLETQQYLKPTPLLADRPPLRRPAQTATLSPTRPPARARQEVKLVTAKSATNWVHELARDPANPTVAKFPFALSVYLLFAAGLIALGWGAILDSVALSVTGFAVALIGCLLYGTSQSDG